MSVRLAADGSMPPQHRRPIQPVALYWRPTHIDPERPRGRHRAPTTRPLLPPGVSSGWNASTGPLSARACAIRHHRAFLHNAGALGADSGRRAAACLHQKWTAAPTPEQTRTTAEGCGQPAAMVVRPIFAVRAPHRAAVAVHSPSARRRPDQHNLGHLPNVTATVLALSGLSQEAPESDGGTRSLCGAQVIRRSQRFQRQVSRAQGLGQPM